MLQLGPEIQNYPQTLHPLGRPKLHSGPGVAGRNVNLRISALGGAGVSDFRVWSLGGWGFRGFRGFRGDLGQLRAIGVLLVPLKLGKGKFKDRTRL